MFHDRRLARVYSLVAGYIRGRIRKGAFRPVNAHVAARAFVGMVTEYGTSEALFGRPAVRCSRNRIIEEMVNLFLSGIAAQTTG